MDGAGDLALVRDIGFEGEVALSIRERAEGGQRALGGGRVLAVDRGDLCATARQGERDGPADAACAARDQGGLSGQINLHGLHLS